MGSHCSGSLFPVPPIPASRLPAVPPPGSYRPLTMAGGVGRSLGRWAIANSSSPTTVATAVRRPAAITKCRDHLPPRAMASRISTARRRAASPGTDGCDRGATSRDATGTGLFGPGALGIVKPVKDRQTDRGWTWPGDVTFMTGRGKGVKRTSRASAVGPPSTSPEDARAMHAIALRSVGQRSAGSFASIRIIAAASGVGHSRRVKPGQDGRSLTCARCTSTGGPTNGGRPVSSS
jgi:hypothetical protein